ncbi:hypothetical protein OROGR_011280 [Orobanche gracilis]
MGLIDHDYHVLSSFKIAYLLLLAATLCYADKGYICSRATYYGSPDCLGNPRGACGFGEYGRTVNNGVVSGVSSRLYMNGSGCGACYQVRCKNLAVCSEDGTKVIVTDYGEGHNTDFILSVAGFSSLAASPNMASELFQYGVLDVEYRRIPCHHDGHNLMLKVHEGSSFPNYLAILAIYQAGACDITAAQVWVEDWKEWRDMRRAYGAVWDLQNPPRGSGAFLIIRIQLTSGDGNDDDDELINKWMDIPSVIPAFWKPGVAYDTGTQL